MKRRLIPLLVVCAWSFCFAQNEPTEGGGDRIQQRQPRQERRTTGQPAFIPGWGVYTCPEGDCQFFTAPGRLLLSVPGLPKPHDLAAEIGVTNAPRVLQPVKGDFTMQVKVEGRFSPGDVSTKDGRAGYNGAGLVLMSDERNVICLARAVFRYQGDDERHYTNFEMRSDGEVQRLGLSGDHPLEKAAPVYLRLERRGAKVRGAVSADGVTWDELPPKELPSTWPLELQAGLTAISTSTEEFNPRFSELQLLH